MAVWETDAMRVTRSCSGPPHPRRFIAQEHENVHQVHRQAMAIDKGQLVLTRTLVGSYCFQPGIDPVSGGSRGQQHVGNASIARLLRVLCTRACALYRS